MDRTLRIAYLSPLAPSRSSVGDYSEELLPYLCQQAQVDVYTDDGAAATQEVGRIYPLYGYRDLNQPDRYDHLLYQLADDAALAPICRRFVQYGGVAVLHDLDLPALEAACPIEVAASASRGLSLWSGGLLGRGPTPRRMLTLAQAFAQRATAFVVHSQAARHELQARVPGTFVRVVPIGIRRPPAIDAGEARRALGIDERAFVCLSVGKLEPHKRLHVVLQALARLRERLPHILYILVGEPRPGYDLRQVAHELGVAECVRLAGHVDLPTLYRYMAAADVGLALRNPERREVPAGLLRMMSMERPVVVSHGGACAEMPDSCLLKVITGSGEVAQLCAALWALGSHAPMRAWYGRQAAQYVQKHHNLANAARGYAGLLEELTQSQTPELAVAGR